MVADDRRHRSNIKDNHRRALLLQTSNKALGDPRHFRIQGNHRRVPQLPISSRARAVRRCQKVYPAMLADSQPPRQQYPRMLPLHRTTPFSSQLCRLPPVDRLICRTARIRRVVASTRRYPKTNQPSIDLPLPTKAKSLSLRPLRRGAMMPPACRQDPEMASQGQGPSEDTVIPQNKCQQHNRKHKTRDRPNESAHRWILCGPRVLLTRIWYPRH